MHSGQPPLTTNPIQLKNLLAQVGQGALRLPDFQRGWVWDDDRIKGLIASMSKGFPIGAVMTMAANGHVAFSARPIEGAEETAAGRTPTDYLLDGQQRLTSLYQALLHPGPVATQTAHGRPIKRRYYIDMRAALEPDRDREEAIASVAEDGRLRGVFGRQILKDLSTPELERERHMIPTERLCDEGMRTCTVELPAEPGRTSGRVSGGDSGQLRYRHTDVGNGPVCRVLREARTEDARMDRGRDGEEDGRGHQGAGARSEGRERQARTRHE